MYVCAIELYLRRGFMRRASKNLADMKFMDWLVEERESILATLEILADQNLDNRLLTLSKSIDDDVAAGRLLTTAGVFGG